MYGSAGAARPRKHGTLGAKPEQTPSRYLKLRLNVSAASPTLLCVPPLHSAIPPLPGSYPTSTYPAPAAQGGDGSSVHPQPSCRPLRRPRHPHPSLGAARGTSPPTNQPPAKGTPETFGVGLGRFLMGSAGKLRPGGTEPVGLRPGTREQRQHHPPGRRSSRQGRRRCRGNGRFREQPRRLRDAGTTPFHVGGKVG